MGLSYTIECDNYILKVKAVGRGDNLAEVMKYGMAVISAINEYGVSRVLCDETELDHALRSFDTFESAKFIADHAPKVSKTAIISKDTEVETSIFWETVQKPWIGSICHA